MKIHRLLHFGPWAMLARISGVHAVPHMIVPTTPENVTAAGFALLQERATDPADFGWIKRWAAIGDSFTAGIGAGSQLGSRWHDKNSWMCSRYDLAYPMLLNTAFGPAVEKFQYTACSGDRSEGIYRQATQLPNNQNLVIMTAGGNDLCLASMIKKCVFKPFEGENACDEVINKAEENIKTILKPNLKSILVALDDKMGPDGIVVFNGYAQFFNTDSEDICTKEQDWAWARLLPSEWFATALKLTVARRKRFNSLVVGINNAIKEVIEDVKKSGNVKYHIGFSDWDRWAFEAVQGQFCQPGTEGRYPDKGQPDLQFFKPDTHIYKGDPEAPLRRRNISENTVDSEEGRTPALTRLEELERRDIYDSLLWNTVNPRAEALHLLNPRDTPAPPSCPGDGGPDFTLGLGLPDSWLKFFHPNELGHVTIASFAMDRLIKLRAEVLGQDQEASCKVVDNFRCWKKEGSRGYATAERMNINYKDFCNSVKEPANTVGWTFSKTYHPGTPDEHSFTVDLSSKAARFDKGQCLDSLDRVVNSCEGAGSAPLNWKFGGLWQRGEYTYRADIKRTNRPWPPIDKPNGDCDSKYKVVLSSFFIKGSGWSSWDWGAQTLKKAAGDCVGSTPSSWKFWYFDKPDKDGNEWSASFNTPIWVRARCFNNNKAQKGAGGLTAGCRGSG